METPITQPSVSGLPRRMSLYSRLRRLPPTMLVGGVILLLYLFVGITGPYWAPFGFSQVATGKPFSTSSMQHFFGTDQLGRDVFSRVVYGTRVDLYLALTSTLLATILGSLVGLVSGFVGGWVDQVIMRLIDVVISIPSLILALLLIAAAGTNLAGSSGLLIFVVAFVYMPRIARMTRSVALDLVTRDFVTIARTRGESVWSIVWNELLPNATGVVLVEFGVRAGYAPIFIGALGFLGLGVRPPTPEWGLMISENRPAIVSAPLALFAPAIALAGLVIGLNLFTDGLARVLGRSVNHV